MIAVRIALMQDKDPLLINYNLNYLPTDLPTNAKFKSKIQFKYNLLVVKLTCRNLKIGVFT